MEKIGYEIVPLATVLIRGRSEFKYVTVRDQAGVALPVYQSRGGCKFTICEGGQDVG